MIRPIGIVFNAGGPSSKSTRLFKVYTLNGQEKAALPWQYARRYYDHREDKEFSLEEAAALPEQEKPLLTGEVSTDAQLQVLVETAIEPHTKAWTAHQDKRWVVTLVGPAVIGLVGVVVGALLGASCRVSPQRTKPPLPSLWRGP